MHTEAAILLTIVWASGLGLLAQILAHRFSMPAIVLLLIFGVLFGPDGLNVVQPSSLGGGLNVLVKLAVAIILFEGALGLRLSDLRQSLLEVRGLVTVGVIITWAGATLAALLIARFSFPLSLLFGALVTVTGPTVVQPLLKRVKVPRRVKAVLEGEAILIDPIGAILAVAVLDIVLGLYGVQQLSVASAIWGYLGRLLIGGLVGYVGALLLSLLLKAPRLVPLELRNLVALAGVWVVFGAAESLESEAGILAAVVMGLALQRSAIPEERRLRLFKEQLTVLAISLLFILLAASLKLEVVIAEGWRGVLTVLTLMFVLRPISVWLSTRHSSLSWREKVFVGWIGPRGIVAASVASLFAVSLSAAGIGDGEHLLALTFLTIALTVTLQGLSAAWVARVLGLASVTGKHVIIVGAGALARTVARVLTEHGRPVMLVDRSPTLVSVARQAGLEILHGNALEEEVLELAGADETDTFLSMTPNPEVNVLAVQLAREAFNIEHAYPMLDQPGKGASPRLVAQIGGSIAFGRAINIRDWEHALTYETVEQFEWSIPDAWRGLNPEATPLPEGVLSIARVQGDEIELTNNRQVWHKGEKIVLLSRVPEHKARKALHKLLV